MKNNLFICFGIIMVLFISVSLVSAWEFDNSKSYDNLKKEVTIKNTFGLGKDLAKIKLDTPLVNYVMPGKDRLVSEMTFESYEDYVNTFNNMKFYDKNNKNTLITRQFKYKIKSSEEYEVIDYEIICEEKLVEAKNGTKSTEKTNCIQKEKGKHKETKIVWTEITKESGLKKGNFTIGVFADVFPGDNVEWIPTLYGVEVTEWATWADSFNIGLRWYFNGNTTINSVSSLYGNITLLGTATNGTDSGILGKAFYVGGSGNGFKIINAFHNLGSVEDSQFTLSFWVKSADGEVQYMRSGNATANGGTYAYYHEGGSGGQYWVLALQGALVSGVAEDLTNYHMVTVTQNATSQAIYINGLIKATAVQAGTITGDNLFSSSLTGNLDELGYWNRTLNSSEISNLYNGGTGITWEPTIIPSNAPNVTLGSPANGLASTNNSIIMNCYSKRLDSTDNPVVSISLIINGVTNTTITNSSVNQNITLTQMLDFTNGTYTWYCNASNSGGQVGTSGDTKSFTVDTRPPNIIFDFKSPSDLNVSRVLGEAGINITYNITKNLGELNLSSIELFYKSNSSISNVMYYENGISRIGYFSALYTDNVSKEFRFNLKDSAILPATYNLNESGMENTTHNQNTLTSSAGYVAIQILNISSSSQYNFFEVMANSSSIIRYYYCNNTFTTGTNPATATECNLIFTEVANDPYDHRHSVNSAHHVVPLTINTSTGMVGTVKVTPTSWFAVRGNLGAPNVVNFYTITNTSRTGAMRTTTNNGGAWTNQTYTVDAHVHQFDTNASLWYYACASDILGRQNCTSPLQDLYTLAGLPPTAPNIYNPIGGIYYKGTIAINYTASFSPNGYDIIQYNISLVNPLDFSFNKTIYANNSNNLSYLWNTVGTTDGYYKISVKAYDNQSQTSVGFSENITIDNTNPSAVLLSPSNGTTKNTDQNYTANITDNLAIQNATLHIYELGGLEVYTTSFLTISNSTNAIVGSVASLSDSTYVWFYEVFDRASNSFSTANRTVTIDKTPPILQILFPENTTYIINITELNYSYSDPHADSCWYSTNGGLTNSTPVTAGTNFTNLSFGSTPTSSLDNGLVAYYNFNSTSNIANPGTRDMVNDAGSGGVITSSPAKIGKSGHVTGADNWKVDNFVNAQTESAWTLNYWLDVTSSASERSMWQFGNCLSNNYWHESASSSSYFAGSGGTPFTLTTDDFSSTWTMYTLVKNSSGYFGYYNGAMQGTGALTYAAAMCYLSISGNGDFYYDELGFWNRSLTGQEINNQLYNGSAGWTMDLPQSSITRTLYLYCNDTSGNQNSTSATFSLDTMPPAVTLNSPVDFFNTSSHSVNLNCSAYNSFLQMVNVSLIIDGVINTTITNSTTNENLTLYQNVNLGDGTYSWTCNSSDYLGLTGTANTRNFTIDSTTPLFNISYPVNNSYYQNLTSPNVQTYSTSSSDLHLDSCYFENGTINVYPCNTNITINLNEGGNTIYFYSNDTLNNTASANVYTFFNYIRNSSNIPGSATGGGTIPVYYFVNTTRLDNYSATITFNGTQYTMTPTVNGNNVTFFYNLSLPIVTSITNFDLILNFTINDYKYSSSYVVASSSLVFGLCGSDPTLNVTYVNYSFLDEATGLPMNASVDLFTLNYGLTTTSSLTFLFTNNTANANYAFCFKPPFESILTETKYFQYSNTGYPQRHYFSSDTLSNATTQKVLYLLSSSTGIYSSIMTANNIGNPITGVEVRVERQFGGVWTLVEQGTTDSSGLTTFWLNPNFDHRYTATKAGYVTQTVIIRPTQSTYSIIMTTGTSNITYTSPIEGVSYTRSPGSGIVKPGMITFTYNVTSSKGNMVNCMFELIYYNKSIIASNSTACTTNAFLSINYNMTRGQAVYGRYYVDMGSGYVMIESDGNWRAIASNASSAGTLLSFLQLLGDRSSWGVKPDENFSCHRAIYNGDLSCEDHPTQVTCETDTDCFWGPSDDNRRWEFTMIVIIFLTIAIIGAATNIGFSYDLYNPGYFIWAVPFLLTIISLAGQVDSLTNPQGLLYIQGATFLPFFDNYIIAIYSWIICGIITLRSGRTGS